MDKTKNKHPLFYWLRIVFLIISPISLFIIAILFSIISLANGSAGIEMMEFHSYEQVTAQIDSTQFNADQNLTQFIIRAELEWKKNNNDDAEAYADDGFSFIKENEVHDSLVAELLHVYGKILIDRQSNQEGIDTLKRSVQLKKRVFDDDHYSLSKAYNYIGIGYFRMRNYKSALKYYKLSSDILVQNNIIGPGLYDSYLNMGIVEAIQGKYDKAFAYFDTTQVVLDSIGNEVDSLLIARFYLNYGLLATLNGRLQEGNHYFNTAEPIYFALYGANYISIADINLNKGINSYYNYDFAKTKLYYKKALDVYLSNNEIIERIPKTYGNLAAVSLKSGNYNQAIQYCFNGLEYDPDGELKWLLYSNLSQAFMAKNDEQNAILHFTKAISLEEVGEISPIKKINLFIEFANFMMGKNQLIESKKYYNKALSLVSLSFGERSAPFADILSNLGYYFYKISSIDSSLYYFDQAIRIWTETPDSTGVNLVTFNEVKFAESYIGRARAFYNKYEETNDVRFLEAGKSDIQMILKRMEEVGSKLDKESKLLLNDQLKPAYDLAIGIAYRLYEITDDNRYLQEAFNCTEKSKSAVLLASVRNLDALKSTDVPADVMLLEKHHKEEINGLRQMLVDEQQQKSPSSAKISFFESRLLRLIIEHDSLVNSLEKNYPRYYSLKYDRSTIQLTDLVAKLNNDEAIIEYKLADSVLYIISITKNEVALSKSIIDSSFLNSLDYLLSIKNIDISKLSKKDFKTFYGHSHHLWSVLIEPVYGKILSKRLIIIPDGVLGYLPFEILAKSADNFNELDFKTMPYLLKESPISYSYSSTLKYNPYFANNEKINNELIAFAPEYVRSSGSSSQSREYNLTKLPNAEQEAKSIEKMWGGKVLTKDNATKSNFIMNAGDYDILHLAMHTLINDSLPMFSKLVFTETDADTATNLLNTYEIYDLDLNASMVTLSACNTGTGRLRTGEGIMSLARGFIYAGVPSIVMTLWEVQDKSGSEIMTEYYQNLMEGDPKDIALQKAKLKFLQSSPTIKTHPFYWSAYIVTGDTQPLRSKNLMPYWYKMFGGILLISLIISLLIIFRKKRSGNTI